MRMSQTFQLSNVLGNVYDWLRYIDGLLTEREVFTVKYRLAFLSPVYCSSGAGCSKGD